MAKSEVSFTHIFTDKAMEHESKGLKLHSGMVGHTKDAAIICGIVTNSLQLAHIVKECLNSFPTPSQPLMEMTLPIQWKCCMQ